VLEELAVTAGAYGESVLRLILAAGLGGIIGLEREASGKPAGFRTNILICAGAALITDVSVSIARDVELPGGFRADPGRIAAQVVSGVGFLGAGTIIRSRGSVTGLTTAATLWVVAAIGIAVGAAAYAVAVTGTALVMLALGLLGRFEARLLRRRPTSRVLRIVLEPRPDLLESVEASIRKARVQITATELEKAPDGLTASYETRAPAAPLDGLVLDLIGTAGVRSVSLH
jgi:putative Mg2+ transporter-C (MgtC) family protein